MDYDRKLHGIYRAVVHDNRDPKKLRRLKVKVTTTGEQITNWILPVISDKRPPAIGSGVYIMYVGGDPEYPVWLGEFAKEPQGIFAYGSWYNTGDLSTTINTKTAVPLNATSYEEGVYLSNSSRLVVEERGTYNIQFSSQWHNTGGGGSGATVFIWFRKNGVDIPNSATSILVANGTYEVVTVNIFEKMEPNDYFEVYWSTTNEAIRIEHLNSTAYHPAVPSIIVTVNQIA